MKGTVSNGLVMRYGPHDFPGGPKYYLHLDSSSAITVTEAYDNIRSSLEKVFTNTRLVSKINKDFTKENNSQNFIHLNFINYGNTELVYKATLSKDNHVAVLINQPHTPLGVVKKEFENLERLTKMDNRFIVKPKRFFSGAEFGHEFYVSEYIPNALCVAHDTALGTPHGVYNPNPYYHFENFSKNMSSIINSNIIALLVNYYDEKNNRGLAQTQVSGNDFILGKDLKKDAITQLPYTLKLIAARNFIEVSFQEYCEMLRCEFLLGTNRDDIDVVSGKLKINHKSKLAMTEREIAVGIAWGEILRSQV